MDPRLDIRGTDFTNSDIRYRAELDVRNVPAAGCNFSLGYHRTEFEDAESTNQFLFNIEISGPP